jgi:hypothetical protein
MLSKAVPEDPSVVQQCLWALRMKDGGALMTIKIPTVLYLPRLLELFIQR